MMWLILLSFLTLSKAVSGTELSDDSPPPSNVTNATMTSEEEQAYFVRKIFDKYGYGGRITFEGFEHLLESLGLAKLRIADHDIHDHIAPDNGFKRLHNDHIHFGKRKRGKKRRRNKNRKRKRKTDQDGGSNTDDVTTRRKRHHHGESSRLSDTLVEDWDSEPLPARGRLKSYEFAEDEFRREKRAAAAKTGNEPWSSCLTSWEIMNVYSVRQENGITEDAFMKICPAMVYQLDIHACTEKYRRDCFHDGKRKEHLNSYHPDRPTKSPGEDREEEEEEEEEEHGHDHDEESGHSHGVVSERLKNWNILEIPGPVWGFATLSVTVISLVGLLGVAIVPIMQKVFYNHLIQFLVALAVGSLTGDALLHLLPHAIQASSGDGTHEKSGVYKGLVALGGIYFFFIAERLMAIVTERRKKKKAKARRRRSLREAVVGQKLSEYAGPRSQSCEDIVMVLGPNKAEVESQMMELKEHAAQHAHDNDHEHNDETKVKDGKGHGHGHSHGDGTPPTSIAAVAWMVILGDGLHNFSDGLAIGAAFANSMTGGLSTSVAVFCHELPHELGDFAVLLKAGMSAKQALFYNMVSSVLCFAGMFIGVALGNISSASLWIFAIAGGMFIYIALVDMLPEISVVETRPSENVCCHLLLHLCGISVGLGIMLLIALFEDQIRVSVSEP